METKIISKSNFLKGIQCAKSLWYVFNRKDLIPELDPETEAVFDQGRRVGELARRYFSKGILIEEEYYELEKAAESTCSHVNNGASIIYEAAAIGRGNLFSRVDIFKKVRGKNEWDIIEVKSSTNVKDYHIDEVAFQRYVFTSAGYNIRKTILMHINNGYIRHGELNVKEMFSMEDISGEVSEITNAIVAKVKELQKVIRMRKEPAVEIGSQCSNPFQCEFAGHCWKNIPEYSVYNIFSGSILAKLLDKNIIKVEDIPETIPLYGNKSIDVEAYKTKETYVDPKGINKFINSLVRPLYYLDYETIFPAIPSFDKHSPYDNVRNIAHIEKAALGLVGS